MKFVVTLLVLMFVTPLYAYISLDAECNQWGDDYATVRSCIKAKLQKGKRSEPGKLSPEMEKKINQKKDK